MLDLDTFITDCIASIVGSSALGSIGSLPYSTVTMSGLRDTSWRLSLSRRHAEQRKQEEEEEMGVHHEHLPAGSYRQ